MLESLQSLLQVSGFEVIPPEWILEANAEEGSMKLDVHIPSEKEVSVHMYYRLMDEVTVRLH